MTRLTMRPLGRLAADQQGNVLVEFGLALPVVLLLLVGAYDHGSGYYQSLRMTGAAHAGAQVALFEPVDWQNAARFERAALEDHAGHPLTDSQIASYPVTAVATPFCACADGTTVTCTAQCGGSPPQRLVRMTLSATHDVMMSYPWADGGSFALSQDAVVRVR